MSDTTRFSDPRIALPLVTMQEWGKPDIFRV
jgi:hypothetical protein